MHYHLEIIMPPTENIEEAVDQVLEEFSEHDEKNKHAFYDWYVIGGRWHGDKIESRIGQEKIEEFFQWCKDEKITVSGVQCGKQSLQPESQIPLVDEMWREITGADTPAIIFSHADLGEDVDICKLSELPPGYKASRVIIARGKANHSVDPVVYEGPMEPIFMWADSVWNGTSWQDTEWDKSVASAVSHFTAMHPWANDAWKEASVPTDDWLCVTVDYHS